MSGDLPRPQGPLLPSCLLPGVHPAASRATAEKPGGGVSPVPQCCLCGRQWPQFPPYGVLHQWTDWGVRDLEKGIKQWDYLSEKRKPPFSATPVGLSVPAVLMSTRNWRYLKAIRLFQCPRSGRGHWYNFQQRSPLRLARNMRENFVSSTVSNVSNLSAMLVLLWIILATSLILEKVWLMHSERRFFPAWCPSETSVLMLQLP